MNVSNIQAQHFMQCWGSQANYKPVEVSHTMGCYIYTADGRKIFDLRSAHECINLGFNHPTVIEAMKRQMDSVIYVTDDFATAPTAMLAQKLAQLAPGNPNKKVWFGQSGAAAIEAAIKAARMFQYIRTFKEGKLVDAPNQYPYPYKIIARYKSWHGSTSGAASVGGDPRRWFQEPFTVPGVVFAPEANAYRAPENDPLWSADYLEYIIEQEGGSNKVAAVLLEPVVGSNGIIPPPPGYMQRVREICDRWGLLLIADETMSGMGRTGKFFAIEHFDVVPDIIVMGKALGVYCPLSACIMSEEVSRVFDDNIFGHGQSFSGHALGCAAALESIRVLQEDGVMENCVAMGQYLGDALKQLGSQYTQVGDVRGMGLFWTMELVHDRESKTPLRKTTEKYTKTVVSDIARFLLEEENIYVPADKFGIWVVPPLIVNQEEVDMLVGAIGRALAKFVK